MATRAKKAAGITPDLVAKTWGKGKLPRAILVIGPESALREQALQAIRKAAFKDGDGDMNWMVMHGPEKLRDSEAIEPATILDEACTRSMFAEEGELKVVVVRKASILLNEARAKEVFERRLPNIPDHAVVVFEMPEPGRFKSTRLYKSFVKNNALVSCESLTNPWADGPEPELIKELGQRAKALGLGLNTAAAVALMDRSGKNLGVLEEELTKLSLFLKCSPEKQVAVTEAHIEKVCSNTRLPDPFEFADALSQRNIKKCLEVLGSIFSHGLGDHKKPGKVVTNETSIAMSLLGIATWKMTQLQDLRAALDGGMQEFAAFRQAKLFGSSQSSARVALRQHTSTTLRNSVKAILKANLNMRTGGTAKETLDQLVWNTCQR